MNKLKSREYLLQKWIPFASGVFWVCMIVSAVLYPPEENFSILTHSISFLGDWYDNPFPGWLFFTVALIWGGVSFFPLGLYIYRRMRVVAPRMAAVCELFHALGCVGVVLVGIFYDTRETTFLGVEISDIHNVVSVIGFGGVGLAMIIYSFFPCREKRKNYSKPVYLSNHKLFLPNFVLLFGIVGMAASQIGRLIKGYDDFPGPGIYSFTLWEWILLLCIWLYHWIMIVVLPKELP